MERKINMTKTIVRTTVDANLEISISDIVHGMHNKEDVEDLIKALNKAWKGSLNILDPICYSEEKFIKSVDKIRNSYCVLSPDKVDIINEIAAQV